jgi:hypothetical protein
MIQHDNIFHVHSKTSQESEYIEKSAATNVFGGKLKVKLTINGMHN